MIITDTHIHTNHSHAKNTAAQMLEAAWENGLKIFGFSEHSPRPSSYSYPDDYQDKLGNGFSVYVQEVLELKSACPEGRKVLLGMEVDFLPLELTFAKQLCAAYHFDYIIGGLHFQKFWGFDSSQSDWSSLPKEARFAIYAQYYKDLEAMCRSGLFNIAAHPDLIKLFSLESFKEWLSRPQAIALIENTLIAMLENNMAMELSSAGLRKPCREIYPGPEIMRLAASLSLPIAVASDAHTTTDVGYAFAELEAYARSFGYTSSLIFEQCQPITIDF